MINHDNFPIRHIGVAELVMRALEDDCPAASDVLRYLSSTNPHLRQMMLETLHDLPDERVWSKLLACLALHQWSAMVNCERLTDPVAANRIDQAVRELFLNDESALERDRKMAALCAGMDDSGGQIRLAAAYLLGLRGDPAAIPVLTEAIETGEGPWLLRAIQALGHIKDERSGPPLVNALSKERELLHHAAQRAISGLGLLAQPALLEALNHPDSHIRWHAARALGETGDARCANLLAEGLYDLKQEVRWTSARVLAGLDMAAVPAILEGLSHRQLTEQYLQAAFHSLNAMLSSQAQEFVKPLLQAMRGPAARIETPQVAQRLLEYLNTSLQEV